MYDVILFKSDNTSLPEKEMYLAHAHRTLKSTTILVLPYQSSIYYRADAI